MQIKAFNGRWPKSTRFNSSNMQGSVQELRGGEYRIRLDDTQNPDFWLECTLVTQPKPKQIPIGKEN
jgi:hypothetical protein